MQRDAALTILQAHKDEIVARFHVRHLALFGSTARNEARDESDIDLLVDFDGPANSNTYFGLMFYLEDLLGRSIDLVTSKALRPAFRPYVEQEAIRVA